MLLAARGAKPKPPSRFCWRPSQRAERATPDPPPARSARIPNEVQVTLFFHAPLLERRASSSATRSRPSNARGSTPDAPSTRIARSRSPVSFRAPAWSRSQPTTPASAGFTPAAARPSAAQPVCR
jgi:hypothetical protein